MKGMTKVERLKLLNVYIAWLNERDWPQAE